MRPFLPTPPPAFLHSIVKACQACRARIVWDCIHSPQHPPRLFMFRASLLRKKVHAMKRMCVQNIRTLSKPIALLFANGGGRGCTSSPAFIWLVSRASLHDHAICHEGHLRSNTYESMSTRHASIVFANGWLPHQAPGKPPARPRQAPPFNEFLSCASLLFQDDRAMKNAGVKSHTDPFQTCHEHLACKWRGGAAPPPPPPPAPPPPASKPLFFCLRVPPLECPPPPPPLQRPATELW